jgi:hypothetical protein
MRSLLRIESSGLLSSNQHILVRAIPSCFQFARKYQGPSQEAGHILLGLTEMNTRKHLRGV